MSSARPQDYAKAYLRAHEEQGASTDDLIEGLIAAASRNNDLRKLPQIARRLEEDMTRASGGDVILITSARELSATAQQEFIDSFNPNDTIRFAIDPALHAGVRITRNQEEEFDATFVRKLSRLFS
jgi:F0F1-type ATP synthase delta subunit